MSDEKKIRQLRDGIVESDAAVVGYRKMDRKRINEKQIGELRRVYLDWAALCLDVVDRERETLLINAVPDLLDALEEAQSLLNKSADRTAWLIEENERLQGMCARLAATAGRLRQALIGAEQKCRRLVGTKTEDHHIAVLEECRVCGARFSSMTPRADQPHRDNCPFKILEAHRDEGGDNTET
jgi:hypothetical protein